MLRVEYLVLFCVLFLCVTCEGGVPFKEYDQNKIDGDSNYYLSTVKASYYDALQLCNEKYMQLVSIESSSKNDEILKVLNGTDEPFWTSGNRIARHTTYWLKGEPAEYNQENSFFNKNNYFNLLLNCIDVIRTDTKLVWQEHNCNNDQRFICEKVKEEVSSPKCDHTHDLVNGTSLSDKKYYIGREIITYSKALQVCRSMCMRLVSIESREKNQDLFEAFVAANATEIFWSSGHFKPGNVWRWTNDKVADFFSWNQGEPNNARENEYCIEILKNDEIIVWNDQPCEEERMFVCETIDKENKKA